MSTAVASFSSPAPRPLAGPDKVAALLLAMGKPLASRLLKHFDPNELKIITRSAAALGAVPITALEGLVEELAQQFSQGVDLRGTASAVENLLGGVLPPDQLAEIMSDVLGSSNSSTWVRLSGLPEKDLAAYVTKEHPQTAALILARLTPEAAAKTLAILPREARHTLTRRMLGLRPVSEATIKILETKLRDDLLSGAPRDAGPNTQARVADILKPHGGRAGGGHAHGDLANQARRRRRVAHQDVQLQRRHDAAAEGQERVVRQAEIPSRVVAALRGTDAAFREGCLAALGARARRMVENELNSPGGSAKETTAARRTVSTTVLQLIATGEIELAPGEAGA